MYEPMDGATLHTTVKGICQHLDAMHHAASYGAQPTAMEVAEHENLGVLYIR